MSEYYEWNNEFSTVYLEDSYVLGLIENVSTIEFLMEFVLTESHPSYHPPLKGEQYCYKNGRIIFPNIKQVEWIEKTFRPGSDATGTIDYGNIYSLTLENGIYEMEGEWGQVAIKSESPTLSFK